MAGKQGIPLNTIEGFPQQAAARLAELWITTAEELVGAARREEGTRGLAAFLGVPEQEVSALVARAQAVLPQAFAAEADEVERHGLGALDEPEDEEPEAGEAAPPALAALPAQVDWHDRLGTARSQGYRGTCVAFACVAVREFLLGAESAEGDLSEQYLYWACKRLDPLPVDGTWVRTGMSNLRARGVCVEEVWPYNRDPIPGNISQGPPPEGADEAAADYRITEFQKLRSRWVDTLRQALSEGKPVAFAVPVYTYWWTEPARRTGDIRLPLSTDKEEGGHAMCMVGYEDDPAVPGGGVFYVRNSWGTSWGQENAIAPGHARIPYAFIEQYARSAFIATLEPQESGCALIRWLRKLWTWLTGDTSRAPS